MVFLLLARHSSSELASALNPLRFPRFPGDRNVRRLVDFFAIWCQPCKMMHPILEHVKTVLGDRIRIIKVDVDKYGVTASQYGIQSVPTLMLFRRGEVLWRTSGVVQKSELLATINFVFLLLARHSSSKLDSALASCVG